MNYERFCRSWGNKFGSMTNRIGREASQSANRLYATCLWLLAASLNACN